jgi:hypothetical protein
MIKRNGKTTTNDTRLIANSWTRDTVVILRAGEV